MNNKGSAEVKLGRPPKEDRGEIIRNNGFSENQWEWLQQEAKSKGVDTMYLVRNVVQWWIDSVEASRAGSVATPDDDKSFETLINNNHSKKKKISNKKKKE